MSVQTHRFKLRKLGESDYRKGLPITTFQSKGSERDRAEYEIGWRSARHNAWRLSQLKPLNEIQP